MRKKRNDKINETKVAFWEKINKIDKHLAKQIKKKGIRNKIGGITTDPTEKRLIQEYYE